MKNRSNTILLGFKNQKECLAYKNFKSEIIEDTSECFIKSLQFSVYNADIYIEYILRLYPQDNYPEGEVVRLKKDNFNTEIVINDVDNFNVIREMIYIVEDLVSK